MKKALFKFDFDCGRSVSLEGVFVSTVEDVKMLVDSKLEVYFGEVLGKHSEVYGPVAESEIKLVTDDENVISVFEEHHLETGFNPFNYSFLNQCDIMEDEDADELSILEVLNKLKEKQS